jgi:CRP/FNR family transcriptional regulator
MNSLNQSSAVSAQKFQRECLKNACANCNLRELCVPGGISPTDLEQLDTIVATRRRTKKGATLFKSGDGFKNLFAVRSGFYKTLVYTADGRNQITGFQAPGELLGLDGVSTEHHCVDAVALEDSEVCILPYLELERIARDFPPLQHQLHRVMSREIVRENSVLLLLGSMKAEERVAAFILNISERYKRLGYASGEFVLRMTRQDIGSFLGLKLETVSRIFSRFQGQGLIEVKGKSIKILQFEVLRQIINSRDL